MSDIAKYLESKGWQHSPSGDEIRLATCPFCESSARAPFSINQETRACFCHACGWKGTLAGVKRAFGDALDSADRATVTTAPMRIRKAREPNYAKPPPELWRELQQSLTDNEAATARYCAMRVVPVEAVWSFRLGLDPKRGIAYPFFERGELTAIKYKGKNERTGDKRISRWTATDPDGQPASDSKTKATLFNVDSLTGADRAYVTEGEDDCIVLSSHGYENVVSVPNGAQSVKGDFLDPLEGFKEIVILFDNDRAGSLGADSLANQLGRYRCRIVTIPQVEVPAGPWGKAYLSKDITDIARAGAGSMLADAIKNSPIETNDRVLHIANYLDELRQEFLCGQRDRGLPTGYQPLDDLIGGRRNGELYVISGNTGSGKSTFCVNVAVNIAQMGEPVLLGCFEQTVPAILRKMCQIIIGRTFHNNPSDQFHSMDDRDLERACQILEGLPIYFVNAFGEMGIEEYRECVEYARRRLDCRMSILDHLHFMLRSASPENERHEIDRAMLALKQITIDFDINQWVVVHPAKKRGDDNPSLSLSDFRGSSFISQVADVALIVWRDRGPNIDPLRSAKIHALKCRSECGNEGSIDMMFEYYGQKFSPSPTLSSVAARLANSSDDHFDTTDLGDATHLVNGQRG